MPLNTRYKGSEAAYILARAGEGAVHRRGLPRQRLRLDARRASTCPHLEHVVVLRGDAPPAAPSRCDDFLALGADVPTADLDDRIAGARRRRRLRPPVHVGHDGRAEGRHVHPRPDAAGVRRLGQRSSASAPATATWSINPFFHSFGYKAGIIASLVQGRDDRAAGRCSTCRAVMATIEPEQITTLPGPPTIFQTILNHPDFDVDRAVVAAPRRHRRRERPGAAHRGACATSSAFDTVAHRLRPHRGVRHRHRRPATTTTPETIADYSGRAIPDVEVRIVDDDGHEVPRGEPGEVVIRGYKVMLGYFEDPEQTAETIDADGWLHTGDVGVMNDRRLPQDHRPQEGHVHRRRVQRLPGRDRVAAGRAPRHRAGVGRRRARRADGRGRRTPSSCSTPAPRADADEIIAWARGPHGQLQGARPRVEVVDALPLNACGKVLKFELRDRAVATLRSGR